MTGKLNKIVFFLLSALIFSACCYAKQPPKPPNRKPAKQKAPLPTPEAPQISRSLSKLNVNGYVCALRCDFLYDGTSSRYLSRPKFELVLTKDRNNWSWLCKAGGKEKPGEYACEGRHTSRTGVKPLAPVSYQWKDDFYNLSVCKDFIQNFVPKQE